MSLARKSCSVTRSLTSRTNQNLLSRMFRLDLLGCSTNLVHTISHNYSHYICSTGRGSILSVSSNNNNKHSYWTCSRRNFSSSSSEFQSQAPHSLHQFRYSQEENNNADDFLRNSPPYKGLVFQEVSSSTPSGSTRFHPTVEKLIQITMTEENVKESCVHERNIGVMNEVLNNLKSLKDKDLLQVLYQLRYFAPCASVKDPDYSRIWGGLDEECSSRMSTWTFDYLFVVADLWNGISLARMSKFHWNVVKKCFRKCDRLTKEQFIRFMFCLNLCRRLPNSVNTHDVELYLNKVCHELNAKEVAIIAMALFKTETRLHDKGILEKLLNIAIKETGTLGSIEVAAIAKLARYCLNSNSGDVSVRFQRAFLPELGRLSVPACTHLALVGTNSQCPDLELVNSVVRKMATSVKEARLKELERIALAMTMFNTDCDDLCHLIVEELRQPERSQEIKNYGRCLPPILHYLSMREIFPEDLISHVLSDEFRKAYYAANWEVYQRELLCLDFAAELELPNYSGLRLDINTKEKLIKSICNRLTSFSKNKVSLSDKALRIAIQTVEAYLGGSEFVYSCKILPHHSSTGIVYCTTGQGEVVKIPQSYRTKKDFEVKYIPSGSENICYNVIFLCTRNIAMYPNGRSSEAVLSGQGRLQVRQLKKMGYSVHIVKSMNSK